MTDEQEMLDVGITLTLRGTVGVTRRFLSERTKHPHDGECLAREAQGYLDDAVTTDDLVTMMHNGGMISSDVIVTGISTRPHKLFPIKTAEEAGTRGEEGSD